MTPTGNTTVETLFTGKQPVNAYQYDICFIAVAAKDQSPFLIPNLPVVCMELLESQGIHALVGRDILTQCLFSYNGSQGQFTLAY